MISKIETQTILYILNKLGDNVNKLKIIKLIYFADRFHIQKYGRLITEDKYISMEKGPVASKLKDLFNNNLDYISKEESNYFTNYIKVVNSNITIENNKSDLEYLSDTDKEALDFSIKYFGNMNQYDIIEETHKYPEWNRFKNIKGSKNIEMIDFFRKSGLENDPFNEIESEIKELSEEFFFNNG